jgi:hypothetical protein
MGAQRRSTQSNSSHVGASEANRRAMPPDECRSEGTPSLSEGPDARGETFWLLLGRLPKVTRCKSGTISRRYRRNGYVLSRFLEPRHPLDNDDLSQSHPDTKPPSLLIQRRPITTHRQLIRIKLDHHTALRRRPTFHRLTTPTPRQNPTAIQRKRLRRPPSVLAVLIRISDIHMSNPVRLHSDLSG